MWLWSGHYKIIMFLIINNITESVPEDIRTVEDVLNWKQIPLDGTAVALNDKLVLARNRVLTKVKDGDRLIIITAAFGG